MRDILNEAVTAMRHNRRRTGLTMLGMAWGIATVVLLLAYGSGFERAIYFMFQEWGVKTIGTWGGRTSLQAGGQKSGTRIRYTLDDVARIQLILPQVRHITPDTCNQYYASREGRGLQVWACGNNPDIQPIKNLLLSEGRFFNDGENAQHAHVVIIGSEAKQRLFSGEYALNQDIQLGGMSFTVIGILKPKMQWGDNDDSNKGMFIPFGAMTDLQDTHYIDGIWLDYQGGDHAAMEGSIRRAMAAAHNFDPKDQRAIFVFDSMKEMDQFNIITVGLKALLAFIGALTLAIGGIGVMNIMLVSVTQRTREIGTLKALGAQRHHILVQFLAEAMTISAIGGAVGIVMSYLVSFSVGRLTLLSAIASNAEGGDIRLIISPMTVVIAVAILGLVGLVSGMVPALRASRLDPIEALRYE
jgi:putative ABC transport system permease protein